MKALKMSLNNFLHVKALSIALLLFLNSMPTYATEYIIPHTVEKFLALCEDTKSKECHAQIAMALDALETTGIMLHSTGVRTTKRSVCFKQDQIFEDAFKDIVEFIKAKPYPSNHMAYAAIIEAAGQLLKCENSGV